MICAFALFSIVHGCNRDQKGIVKKGTNFVVICDSEKYMVRIKLNRNAVLVIMNCNGHENEEFEFARLAGKKCETSVKRMRLRKSGKNEEKKEEGRKKLKRKPRVGLLSFGSQWNKMNKWW